MDWSKEFPCEKYCELISSGKTEPEALDVINTDRILDDKVVFHEAIITVIQVRNQEFRDELEEAKKRRADVWFNGIIQSTRKDITKEDAPGEKLKFEQRKYLASIDNPERYSEKIRHDHDVRVNIFQEIRELKAKDIPDMIAKHDPFVIEAESTVVESEELEEIFE